MAGSIEGLVLLTEGSPFPILIEFMKINFSTHCIRILIVLSLLAAGEVWGESTEEGISQSVGSRLSIAAVQFTVDDAYLSSVDMFRSRITGLVERCMSLHPDLIIFPEYTSAFAALIPYHKVILQAENILEGFERIREREPLVWNLQSLFLFNSGFAERVVHEVFGNLARKYSVCILGGTYFAWERTEHGQVLLKNRAFIFGRDGKILHTQDKVYLTEFETILLNLSAGSISRVEMFQIAGHKIGLTICRDTFQKSWVDIFTENDLWIDIKANGTAFTQSERESFLRALPARIKAGNVPYGITVCLTGRFLDLLWEGESSLVQKQGDEVRFLRRAESPRDEEILFFTLESHD